MQINRSPCSFTPKTWQMQTPFCLLLNCNTMVILVTTSRVWGIFLASMGYFYGGSIRPVCGDYPRTVKQGSYKMRTFLGGGGTQNIVIVERVVYRHPGWPTSLCNIHVNIWIRSQYCYASFNSITCKTFLFMEIK